MTIAATATHAAGRKNLAGPRDLTSARQSSRGAGAESSREKIPPGASLSARFSPASLRSSSPGRRAFAVEPRLTAASRATRSDAAREAPAVRDSSASLSHWSTPEGWSWSLPMPGPGRCSYEAECLGGNLEMTPASRSSKSSATLELELESTRAKGPAENRVGVSGAAGEDARRGSTHIPLLL